MNLTCDSYHILISQGDIFVLSKQTHTNLSSNSIILAVQQDKHGSDELWILNN